MKLSNNLTIEQRLNTEWGNQFDPMQHAEIIDGATLGVNAETYANPDHDYVLMREIKDALAKDPSLEQYIEIYTNRCYPYMTFGFLSECVKHDVNVDVITQLGCSQCSRDAFAEIEMLVQEGYDFSQCKTTTEFMETYHKHVQDAYENTNWLKRYRDMRAEWR